MRFLAWLRRLQWKMDRLCDRLMGVRQRFFVSVDWGFSDGDGVWIMMRVDPDGTHHIIDHGTIHYETEPLV